MFVPFTSLSQQKESKMNMVHGTTSTVDEGVPLPGFRFHPTEEELVGFYLRQKVDNNCLTIELIKEIDIYKYDPSDLPKTGMMGENDLYFFCKRGRKYRNSVRPNRVTGSGFWKATGIDKPVFSVKSGEAIGLKKTLVYYHGSAGKGTKTDWMMHEFRLPNPTLTAQEAEVWTICRIFKRNKKIKQDSRQGAAKRASTSNGNGVDGYKRCSVESNSHENYITIGSQIIENYDDDDDDGEMVMDHGMNDESCRGEWYHGELQRMASSSSPSSSFSTVNDFFTNANWDELKSILDLDLDPFLL
ncbi:transcription factor JUNGBRUNNEN 1 isoform X2 [Gossypium raimondii]|uniref:NAC domain-containing protein n=1 Tax=Gossypium raimondii TaxID=29730 RepID=A0A0D2RBG7_GOSRA|nr:transcription factor JUNGBRUNNEN 1 isoform X2 [Gossypium raimondii]KJB26986.1 hypothetical protein B456_004G270200 [Gossypium raimondii]